VVSSMTFFATSEGVRTPSRHATARPVSVVRASGKNRVGRRRRHLQTAVADTGILRVQFDDIDPVTTASSTSARR